MSIIKKVALADPEKRRRVAEKARQNLLAGREGVDYGAIVRKFASSLTPEQRSRHFGRRGHKRGISGVDLDLYETLRRKGVPAAEARVMVDDSARRRVASIAAEMRAKEERRKREEY